MAAEDLAVVIGNPRFCSPSIEEGHNIDVLALIVINLASIVSVLPLRFNPPEVLYRIGIGMIAEFRLLQHAQVLHETDAALVVPVAITVKFANPVLPAPLGKLKHASPGITTADIGKTDTNANRVGLTGHDLAEVHETDNVPVRFDQPHFGRISRIPHAVVQRIARYAHPGVSISHQMLEIVMSVNALFLEFGPLFLCRIRDKHFIPPII